MGLCGGCGEWIRETYYLEYVGVELCWPCYEREGGEDEDTRRDSVNDVKVI